MHLPRPSTQRGFTLIELLMSLVVVSILMAGMGIAMTIAVRSLESSSGPAAETADAAAIATQMNAELRLALDIKELTAGSVLFTVPDRDLPPDGQPESIRYAWSGEPGDPLTRSYNGAAPVSLADDVCTFELLTSSRAGPGGSAALLVNPDAWGYFTDGAQAGCDVLFVSGGSVVKDLDTESIIVTPTAQEDLRISLLESWGHTVTVISAHGSKAYYDTAAADSDVAYVSEQAGALTVGTKLSDLTIGVVSEQIELCDELGFAQTPLPKIRDEIQILDDAHYITAGFPLGALTIMTSTQPVHMLSGMTAPGLGVLAETSNIGTEYKPSLAVLDTGDAIFPGGIAAGRRVQLPWGDAGFDFAALNGNGRTILKRAIEWAGGAGENVPVAQTILLVVADPANLTTSSSGRKTLFESWGYTVTLIDDGETQAIFDAAVAASDVAYVSSSISGGTLAHKLTGAAIGIVNEFPGKLDNFGLSSGTSSSMTEDTVDDADATHYITSIFNGSSITVFTQFLSMPVLGGTLAPDLQYLAGFQSIPAVAALEKGATRFDGGTAPARRVHLPYGNAGVSSLTADGQTLMQRAIEWAAADVPTLTVLYVVGDPATPTTRETGRRTLMESWNLAVLLIDDADSQTAFDTKLATADAVYVADSITPSALGTKLDGTSVGIVNENDLLIDRFGFAAGSDGYGASQLVVFDPGHYVTSTLTADPAVVFTTSLTMRVPSASSPAPDMQRLLEHEQAGPGIPAVVAIGAGGLLSGAVGGSATSRRIHLPFAGAETSQLTADGQTIMQRSIEWAAGSGDGGGAAPSAGVVFEAFAEVNPSTTYNVDVPVPAGTVEGDLLIAAIASDETMPSVTPPAGWNLIALQSHTTRATLGVWWKIAAPSEPGTHQFLCSQYEMKYGWMMRFTGHDPANPIHVISSFDQGSSTTPTCASVTTTVDDCLILRVGGFDHQDITVDDPGLAGHTPITMDLGGSGLGACAGGAGYVQLPAAGDSGTATFTLTAKEEYVTGTIAIAPDPG